MENVTNALKLRICRKGMDKALSDVESLLPSKLPGNLPPKLLERLLCFLEFPAEIACFDRELELAEPADEARILLKPSNSFTDFLLALRAWNREFNAAV